MSVVINHSQSEIYFGQLRIATAAVAPGACVVANDANGTCAIPAANANADGLDIYMVTNYDPYADTDIRNSVNYTVAVDKYARLKPLEVGDTFTTDQFIGAFAGINVGDIFAVNGAVGDGVQGRWIAIGARTPVLRARVIEKTTIYGQNALKFRVIAA